MDGGAAFDYELAFSRNIGLVTAEEQQKIRSTTVALPGLGGCGGVYLETLLRAGFERFHLADIDSYELANFNRQSGAFVDTIGTPKLDAMEQLGRRINPEMQVKRFPNGVTDDNLSEFLDGAGFVLDAIEVFEMGIRRVLYAAARERNIPVLFSAPLGFTATLFIFGPKSPSFDEYFDIHDGMSDLEKVIQFLLGIAPRGAHLKQIDPDAVDLKNRRGPSISPAVKLSAGLMVTQAMNLLLGRRPVRYVPCYHQLDALTLRFKSGRLVFGNRSPWQRLKRAVAVRRFVDTR